MTPTKLLIGSLSNDLFRVASLTQRGSHRAALRFLEEAKRWAKELEGQQVAGYIHTIITDVSNQDAHEITIEQAEKHLMYGILLQNYALHTE